MQIKDVDKLKGWLFSKLEPLCDADPTALSKYVVALLRKEKPKAALKELCIDQLEVFLAKETVAFVEKLFRCLESESYLKREDTPPPSPPKSKPTEQPQATGKNVDRRQSEDIRRKEVDDDDRDFRRSKRHESEGSGEEPKRPTAPITVGRGDSGFAGKKRRNEDGGTSSGIKRRMMESRSKPPESSASTSGSVDTTSTTASTAGASEPPVSTSTAGRRPVRERLGPRPPDDRSDGNRAAGRRHHRSHSPSHSWTSSSSDNDSGSDSDSSTGSSVSGGKLSRKRRRHVPSKEAKKRQRCKDYDERGFCILGESCPYDHGVDPLVVGGGLNPYPLGLPPPPGLPLPPLGKPPNLLVPPLLPPVLPPAPRVSPPPPTTTTIDGYNPEDPGLSSSSSSRGFIPTPIIPPRPIPLQQTFPPPPSIGGISIPPPPSLMSFPPPRHLTASTTLTASTNFYHQGRPRPPFGGRGPGRPSDTLIIRKIPRELNTITKLSSHFEKFGTVVNLTVRYEGDPEGALVQFSSPVEAKKAHSSTEAVLNNRFIRIYFLRKDHFPAPAPLTEITLESPASVAISRIHGVPPAPPSSNEEDVQPVRETAAGVSSREETENHVNEVSKGPSNVPPHSPAVKASPSPTSLTAPVQSLAPPTSRSIAPPPPQSHAPPPQISAQQRRKSAEAAKKKLELQKKSSELLQKQIQQQKLLISKLEKSGKHLSSEEKDTIMKSLKTLSSSISKLKEAATKTVATSKSKPETAAAAAAAVQKPAPIQQQHQQQKQQTTDDLKAKADALRKQAHMLGLLSSPSQPLPATGKGHNQHRDLRTKLSKQQQLLVMNVANRDQLTSYFDSFGGLDGVEVDPGNPNNLIFTFRNKTIANQVVNKGSTLNGKPLIMKWYTPKPGASVHPTLPTVKSPKHTAMLPHHQTADISKPTSLDITSKRVVVERQPSISDDQLLGPTTPTLTKLDPEELHLVDDSDEEEEEGRSWRR